MQGDIATQMVDAAFGGKTDEPFEFECACGYWTLDPLKADAHMVIEQGKLRIRQMDEESRRARAAQQ